MLVYKPLFSVVLQEVPGEISIGFQIKNCRQGCVGCSYKSYKSSEVLDLSLSSFEAILKSNFGLATCVLFMGGEDEVDLPIFLDRAKSYGYKTCMYTGLMTVGEIDIRILSKLDYCKVGRWEGKGLRDPSTNQRFFNVLTGEDLTSTFQRII